MSDMTPPPAPQWTPPPAPPAPPAPPYAPPQAPPVTGGRPGPVNDTSKIVAAISICIWPVAIFAIIAEPYKSEKFVKFHAFQGLVLGIAASLIGWLLSTLVWSMFWTAAFALAPIISLFWIVVGIYFIFLAVKVYNGTYVEVPVVYGIVKSYIGE